MTEYILQTKELEYSYPDGTKALKGLSLTVQKGVKLAVLGPNGAGKSTLFLHLNGLFKPLAGALYFKGKPVQYNQSNLMQLRSKVGIVFQDPDSQLFSSSVWQEISFGPMNLGLMEEEVRTRVEQAMVETGITELRDRPTHGLSYGQKKRVAMAGVLAMEPEVLIIDEPTAWLDKKHEKQLIQLLDAWHESGKTVMLSTHDVDLAFAWAEEIIVLKDGVLVGNGTPLEIFSNHQLVEEAGLSRPLLMDLYMTLLEKGWVETGQTVPKNLQQLLAVIPSKNVYR